MEKSSCYISAIAIIIVFIVLFSSFVVPKMTNALADEYLNSRGVSALTEGTVSGKQYCAAHSNTYSSIFASHTEFYPEQWQINIRRYDSSADRWETTTFEVDKTTYDQLNVGDHFKDPLERHTFFMYE
ncbi:hypothetical protein [Clostridium sp. KNHs216]|uniref:hypothetical protein n=1 Tax=Clostridium sp. KNHs216 TaxID=1550235 RepID=UPI00114EEC8A|nr:hypothetical protein [Clostridium sp. KNHs216]